MEKLEGKSIFKRIAIGKILFYEKQQAVINEGKSENPELEMQRYQQAKEKAIAQLQELYKKACEDVGEESAEVFDVHAMLLDDDDYNDSVKELIEEEHLFAENAVTQTGEKFAQMFLAMDDEYFQARSADMRDISERVVNILCGVQSTQMLTEPVILVAKDLAPSETVQMDKEKLLAFVTELGSENSHTAILARTMSIPALIGIEINPAWNGKTAVVDGYTGTLYVDPDADTMAELQKKYEKDQEEQKLLESLKGKPDETKSGRKVKLYANIGNVSDVETVLKNDAAGIGLFRSEFLYLEQDHLPTEEEQFAAYKAVAEKMGGKKVVIRTMDIGADKQADYFHFAHEENPAMGYRAIRICLTQTDIFKTQLRALLRAANYGTISVMYPMIISVKEVKRIKEIVKEVQEELTKEQIPFGEIEQGIMIETPAAAVISDELAKEVDFFSIGTNDLTQYTLAIDRQNANLGDFYDSHHPAILRLIEMTVKNGHAHDCWVGICGELGADLTLTETFLKMGIDELSVSPGMVLPLRKKIRDTE
ncbi:MAG: phosphoenolpyruvate--protein phosphotransferase [Lachnospiraceae bacterium]